MAFRSLGICPNLPLQPYLLLLFPRINYILQTAPHHFHEPSRCPTREFALLPLLVVCVVALNHTCSSSRVLLLHCKRQALPWSFFSLLQCLLHDRYLSNVCWIPVGSFIPTFLASRLILHPVSKYSYAIWIGWKRDLRNGFDASRKVHAYIPGFFWWRVLHYKITHTPEQSKRKYFFFLEWDVQAVCRQELQQLVIWVYANGNSNPLKAGLSEEEGFCL